MSMSTTIDNRPTAPQRVAMVAGPALLLAGFAIHPSDSGGSVKVLQTIAGHHAEWVAAHLLLFAAAALLVPAILALARMVTGPARRIAAIASGLVVFASIGLAGAAAFEQLIGVAATLHDDAGAMSRLIEAAEKSTAVLVMLVTPQLAVAVGFLGMAWALYQSKVVPAWSAAAMGLGAVTVMAPEPFRCVGAALLLSTFVVAARRGGQSDVADLTVTGTSARRSPVAVS